MNRCSGDPSKRRLVVLAAATRPVMSLWLAVVTPAWGCQVAWAR
jgi:hypothetical protein